jgi:hypothetical protein
MILRDQEAPQVLNVLEITSGVTLLSISHYFSFGKWYLTTLDDSLKIKKYQKHENMLR